jgi:hypothetical protein
MFNVIFVCCVVLCALYVFSIEPNIGPGWFAGPADQSTLSGMVWYGMA